MKTIQETISRSLYGSEVLAEVYTTDAKLAKVIEWADAHPVVWKIVTGTKSKVFGRSSCVYIGWAQRSNAPEAVLERTRHFHELVTGAYPYARPDSIFIWRAQFTLDHYEDKTFMGGFFQQHDAKYPRSCLDLDYTDATLEEVIGRFCQWMDRHYDTARITVDGRTVQVFQQGRPGQHTQHQPTERSER